MRDDTRFALVLRASGNGIAPGSRFDYGVCLVDGDTATTSFVDMGGLARVVGDFPCVPSVYGVREGIVSFEAEMEAVDTLTSAARELSDKYATGTPPGYGRLLDMVAGGFMISSENGRIGFEIADWVAQSAGWHTGDRLDVAVGAGGAFAIFASREGAAVVSAGRPGWLTAVRDWRLPLSFPLPDGEWRPEFSVDGGRVYFELPSMPAEVSVRTEIPDLKPAPREALPRALPIDYRWSPVVLAFVYAVLAIVLNFV